MNNFFRIYFPFLITFINKRLITQTDIVFAAIFGSSAIAAAGIPNNLMIIDQITAMAITPILSMKIADLYNNNRNQFQFSIEGFLTSLFKLSVILSILGFCLYPILLKLIVKEDDVLQLSCDSLFWLNLSIVPEFFRYCMSVCLNSCKKGNFVIAYSCFEVVMNIILNYVFVKCFDFGYVGIYIATFIVSSITCILTFNKMKSEYNISIINIFFKFSKDMFQFLSLIKTSIEFARICVEKISFLLMICVINLLSKSDVVMSAFTISLGIYFLVLMPNIALMRTITVCYIQEKLEFDKYKYKIIMGGFCLNSCIAVFIFVNKLFIIESIFGIENHQLAYLTSIYINMVLLLIPLQAIITFQRGMLYAHEKIKFLALIDIFNYIFFVIPLFIIGQIHSSPILTWSGFFIAQISCLLFFDIVLHERFFMFRKKYMTFLNIRADAGL